MNYTFASIKGLGPGSLPYLRKIHNARRAENFSGNKQNSSRIRVSEQNFKQNKQFLRALPAGRISHFTSENLSKPYTLLCRAGLVLRRFTPKTTIVRQYAEQFGNPHRRSSGKPTQNAAWTFVKCSVSASG